MAELLPLDVAEAGHDGLIMFHCISVICVAQLHGQVVRVMVYLSMAIEE